MRFWTEHLVDPLDGSDMFVAYCDESSDAGAGADPLDAVATLIQIMRERQLSPDEMGG